MHVLCTLPVSVSSLGYIYTYMSVSVIKCVRPRAVEPDFKKSNKKPDAKVGYRRLYPTFA